MTADLAVAILGIVITTSIAIYAINDVRKEVKKTVKVARDLAYLRISNDIVWEFIDPTESTCTPEIAKGLHEFGFLAQALNPEWNPEDVKTAVEKEALEFADELVKSGRAKWKKDFDLDKVREAIGRWQAEKNIERVKKIMGETRNPSLT